MTVETVTYITDLDKTYPAESETGTLHEGNDHLRNIKKALENSFPNFVGAPVTATEAELNFVDGVTSAIQTQLAAKAPLASPTFTGTVVLPSDTTIGSVSSTELGYVNGVTSAIQTQLAALMSFDIQFILPTGANGTYVLVQKASFGFTIDAVVHDTQSGSIACAVQIDGSNVGGCSALTVDSSETESDASSPQAVSAGNTVQLVLSSNSAALGVSIQLKCTRT